VIVDTVIAEINEIVRPDGAELRVVDLSPTSLHLALDLTNSTCPECVVPRQLMLDILQSQLATLDPDIRTITLDDPREPF
jgi:hypothetical protein